MISKSINGASIAQLKSELASAMTDDFKPTLALVFISIRQDRQAICDLLSGHGIDIIGATSSGEFMNEHQSTGETVILLLNISRQDYRIMFSDTHNRNIPEIAQDLGRQTLSAFERPSMIMCSTCFSSTGNVFDGQGLIDNIGRIVGPEVDIFGGMAGDDGTISGTYVFTATQSTDEGIVLLVLNSERILLQGMAISGWKPLGKIRKVTKCEDGWMYTIDDQPALEMYLRYLGESLVAKEGIDKLFIEDISVHHPFLSVDDGTPVIRTPISIDKSTNGIKLDFPISEGKHLQFTMPPDFDIVETVLSNATSIRDNMNTDADALLIFSCMGRLSALGPLAQEENDGLAKVWNAPMAGFFTYGEFGKGETSKHEFHSTTCSWVALKEI